MLKQRVPALATLRHHFCIIMLDHIYLWNSLQSVQIKTVLPSHRKPCCRDGSHIRPSKTSKLHFSFDPDSSQIVGRQHRQKRQLQIRYVYRYRRHAFSLNLHWFYRCPQHIEKRRANASHNLHHDFDLSSRNSHRRHKILEREYGVEQI